MKQNMNHMEPLQELLTTAKNPQAKKNKNNLDAVNPVGDTLTP